MRRIALLVVLGITLAACSAQPQRPAAQFAIADQEARELQPLVNRYKSQAVMGLDVKGTTLVLSADAEGWSELDEPTEIALKNAVLDAWARVWEKHHPHGRALLRLRVQNYYGQEITSQTRQV